MSVNQPRTRRIASLFYQITYRIFHPSIVRVFHGLQLEGQELERQVTDLKMLMDELSVGLQKLEKIVIPIVFNGSETIEQAWNSHPQAAKVFARYHLPACNLCAVRFDETLDEAFLAYSLPKKEFLHALNQLHKTSSGKN